MWDLDVWDQNLLNIIDSFGIIGRLKEIKFLMSVFLLWLLLLCIFNTIIENEFIHRELVKCFTVGVPHMRGAMPMSITFTILGVAMGDSDTVCTKLTF